MDLNQFAEFIAFAELKGYITGNEARSLVREFVSSYGQSESVIAGEFNKILNPVAEAPRVEEVAANVTE